MPHYMLLLHESTTATPEMGEPTPETFRAIVQRHKDWADELRRKDRLRGGGSFSDDYGRVLRRGPGGRVTVWDGPFAETREVIGGYFTIAAASYDEAVEIAFGCPHLAFGGTIEIRQVDESC